MHLLLLSGVVAASLDGLSIPIKSTSGYLHGPPIFYSTFTLSQSGQHINLVMDTGSSDTWAVANDFECTDRVHLLKGQARRQEDCHMGEPIKEGSFATAPVKQNHIKMSYADGEFLMGAMANTTLDLNPLNVGDQRIVINQRVGLPDKVAFNGDGITSGLAGLGFAALTSQYRGSNESSTQLTEIYSPFVQTVLDAGNFTKRMISVVLGNDKLAGSLIFNGYPQRFDDKKAHWARKRLLQERNEDGVYVHREYLFAVDEFVFEGADQLESKAPRKTDGTRYRAIADTGTNGILVPVNIAQAYNSLWTPDCNATAPAFAVVIDGVRLAVDRKELLLKGGFDHSGMPSCHSAIMATSSTTLILGHSFMVSAVTVVDFEDMTISFADRESAF